MPLYYFLLCLVSFPLTFNFILLKHRRIPFNERASQYRQDFHSIVCTGEARWMDRHSWKGSGELWKCFAKSFRTSPLRWYWADKEALKFWYWKKTGETGMVMNYFMINIWIWCIFLGFLAYIYISECAVSVVLLLPIWQ